MGIKVTIELQSGKDNTHTSIKSNNPTIEEISVVLAQMELVKIKLLGKIATNLR